MSIIKIKEDHSLWMHDHLRDLGREIVRQEHEDSERRSRLWNEEEATKLLTQKLRSDTIRGINLNFKEDTKYPISTQEFAGLPNLRFLHVRGSGYKWKRRSLNKLFHERPLIFSNLKWLSWHGFPHKYDISNCSIENLMMLDLSYSKIKSSWKGWCYIKMAKNLKVLNLTGCERLDRTPNFANHPKLERLIFRECSGLVEIDESICLLKHLIIIDLTGCYRLHKLPKLRSCMESLEEIIIDYTQIEEISNWAPMRRLRVFSCSQLTASQKLSMADNAKEFIRGMVDVVKEHLRGFKAMKALPEWIKDSVSLIELDLSGTKIIELPDTIGNLKNLKVLSVMNTPIRTLPPTIGMLENLITLDASNCDNLHNIPKLPQSLISLKVRCEDIQNVDLSNLINLKNLEIITSDSSSEEYAFKIEDPAPWWIGRLTNLESLTLGLQQIINLQADLGKLSQLTKLELSNFANLESIPNLPHGLKKLSIYNCEKLQRLPDLSDLKKLRSLCVDTCPNLVEIPGTLESLDNFEIHDCKSLERIPYIPNSKIMGSSFCIKNCGKIKRSSV